MRDVPLGLNQDDVPTIGDSEYELPLRPYVRFMDRNNTTSYIFDAFRSSNDLNVVNLETERGIGETGSAVITIEDSTKQLDETLLNWGNKVCIKIAKNQWEFSGNPQSTFLIGYVKGYTKDRPQTGVLQHIVRVQGSGVLFSERKVNYKKSTKSSSNTKFLVKNHVKSILQDASSYPIIEQSIAQQGGFDLSGISDQLNTFVGTVNFELIEGGNAMDRLANIEGARWFIDYISDKEIFTMKFPTELNTGVTIKSKDLATITDPGLYTSWFFGNWQGDGDITGSTGFANRLFTKTQIDQFEFTSSFTNNSSTTLANKALAQKFFITETRISDVAFLLSKVGEPTSTNNRVNGRIIADNNNSPTGNIISAFNIPLDSIEKTPQTIFVNDLKIKDGIFVSNAQPAWLVLYQRSGTDEVNHSEPNTDEQNTIRWHHNNDTSTVTTLVSKTASSGDRDDNLTWNFITASDKGPTFGFGVFAEIRHIQEVSDKGSINRYGQVDAEIDTSFLVEPDLINTYLYSVLYYSSRPRLVFSTGSVKCPSRFLFKPYQIVTLKDSLAYPQGIDCEIQRARYNFDTDKFALGCRTVDITPMSYFDYLDENWKCS